MKVKWISVQTVPWKPKDFCKLWTKIATSEWNGQKEVSVNLLYVRNVCVPSETDTLFLKLLSILSQ